MKVPLASVQGEVVPTDSGGRFAHATSSLRKVSSSAAVTAMLPVILVYAFLQKAFVQGLSAGAVKG